jgi:hypothetical protein
MSPREHFGLSLPLQDIELRNVAAIAKNIDHRLADQLDDLPFSKLHPMTPTHHMKSAKIFINSYDQQWKYYNKYQNLNKLLLLKDNKRDLLLKKLISRGLGSDPEVTQLIGNFNKIQKNTPDYILYNQIKLTYNALPTLHRLNSISSSYQASNTNCLFFQYHPSITPARETIEHLFGGSTRRPHCPVLEEVRLKIATIPGNLHLSYGKFHHHLLLSKLTNAQVPTILAYNLTVWITRNWLKSREALPPKKTLIHFFTHKFLSTLPKTKQ